MNRFEAEEILREAASGSFPAEGNVLIRGSSGWFFGNLEDIEGGGESITFSDILGFILDGQVPSSAVTQHQGDLSIAFTQLTGQIADGQVPESAVTQHEAALSLLFTQLTDQVVDAQVPESAVLQYEEEFGYSRHLMTMGG